MPKVAAAALLIVITVAVSCGTPDTHLTTEAAELNGTVPPADEALPVPFASVVELDDADAAALHDAVEAVIARCMTDAGFVYDPQPYATDATPPPLLGNLSYATASGYGIVESFNAPGRSADDGLSPEWREALLGAATFEQLSSDATVVTDTGGMRVAVDPDSCASRARTVVYGDDLTWQQARARLTYLQHLAYTDAVGNGATTDPTWTNHILAWQACMAAHGYDLPTPLAAIPALEARAHSPGTDIDALRAEELAVATADATCVHTTGLADTAHQRLAEAEAQVSAAHPDTLTVYTNLLRDALERAGADRN